MSLRPKSHTVGPATGRPLLETPPPDLRDKMRRALWGVAWLFLYRTTPVPMHAWRRMLLRLFGGKIGSGAHPYPTAKIWAPWNLVMQDRACLAAGVICYSAAPVVLEQDAIVSQGAHLCAASHDFRKPDFPLVTGAIVIGRGAWVAAEAFVGPAVTIGVGAVVGARAVVVRDVPANVVVAGNPARVVGARR